MSSDGTCCYGLFSDAPVEGDPLLIEDSDGEDDRQPRVRNIYAPTSIDGTELHRAIRSGDRGRIDEIVMLYQDDFDKVKEDLVKRFGWNEEERIWLEKSILVARTEDQCRNASAFECCVGVEFDDLREAIFVLLQNPVEGKNLVVMHPNFSDRLKVAQLIETLIPNGFLTWNYTGVEGKCETFMEVAASCGEISVMRKLYELGAKIAIPGHNPLIQACRRNRKNIIDWLLEEHFENFDCTLRDCNQYNALAVSFQRNDLGLVVKILEKMMAYRQKYFNENESQAFSEIFRFEAPDAKFVTIFSQIGSEDIQLFVEEAIAKYRLDLSYQNKNYSVLIQLLTLNKAVEYCLGEIRKNPNLLKHQTYGEHTALHQLLQNGYSDFLDEVYRKHPTVKEYFNTDGAFKLLQWLFWNKHHRTIEFILEHHLEFLRSDLVKLEEMLQYYKEDCRKFSELRSIAEHWKDVIQIDESDILVAQPPLYHAVSTDNHILVNDLLNQGKELNALGHNGSHAIHHVKSLSMLKLLIERHPDGVDLIHRTDSSGCTVLHHICGLEGEEGVAMLELVIKLGANVQQLTYDGESALFFARNLKVSEILMKHNLQLDLVSITGETALQRILSNAPDVANSLFPLVHKLPSFREHAHKYLSAMTSFSTRSFFNFHYRDLLNRYPETTKLLFDSLYQASPNEASKLFAEACARALNYVVEKFLDFDYDTMAYSYQNEYLNAPLTSLVGYMEEPNAILVQRLLAKNVAVNAQNSRGQTALHLLVKNFKAAKLHGHDLGTVQMLINRGAHVNTSDRKGHTALHLAFQQRDWELVDVLIRNGADADQKNRNGKRPRQMLSVVDQELFYFW